MSRCSNYAQHSVLPYIKISILYNLKNVIPKFLIFIVICTWYTRPFGNAFFSQNKIFGLEWKCFFSFSRAVNQLNGYEFEGNPLKVEMASAESRRRGRSQRGGVAFSGIPGSGRQTDFPLRILVQSDMVGAIIGRQGSTIRQITQMTRARVDVHRKDNVGSLEKAITIYGNPENCTNACKKILEVMQQEATNTNKGLVFKKKTEKKLHKFCGQQS